MLYQGGMDGGIAVADTGSVRPVQSYSREAERISEKIGQPNSDPKLVDALVIAMRVQATEISDFLIKSSERRPKPASKA